MESKPIKVLLVEDDEDDFLIVRDLLSDALTTTFQLDWVSNYSEGLPRVLRCEHQVYLIDYRLGEHTGVELLRLALEGGCRAPIIMLTSQGDQTLDLAAMKAGAADYLIKGQINPILLERSIRYAIERKNAEEALRESEERYRSVVDTATDAIITFNEEGITLFANHAAEQIFGYSADELVGQPFTLLIDPARPEGHHTLEQHLKTGNPDSARDKVALPGWHKSGRPIPLELSFGEFTKDGKRIFTSIIRDISERRQAERALQEINAELETFAYSVSHDLRAPLRAMQGFSKLLLEDHAHLLNAEGQDYVWRIVTATSRLDGMIQDLLDYSRLSRDDLKMQTVPLTMVIDDVLTQLEAIIQERQAEVAIEPPLPSVRGNRATLMQMVGNLVSNAVKFVPPGRRPKVRIGCTDAPDSVRLWVEDNGIGIERQYHERIFRIFERLHADDAYPGTGIGLAIVRKGIERMGGQVGVESIPGKGSKFYLVLPKAIARTDPIE
jgi:PAS domain S-box-containing protein